MNDDIDLNFRPDTYFRPQKLERYLLSKVKGAVVRKKLQVLFDEGRHAEVRELLTNEALSANDRKMLESFHPMFMGGNYLPDIDVGEVEICRISIASTTCDVTCVYARPVEGAIHYRVVDEYGGDTLSGRNTRTSIRPLTLGQLEAFFTGAWSVFDVLEMNFGDDGYDLEQMQDFVVGVDSEFYPDLGKLYRQRVANWATEPRNGGEHEDESAGEPA